MSAAEATTAAEIAAPHLQVKYEQEIKQVLKERFKISNDLAAPVLKKININMGVNGAVENKARVEIAAKTEQQLSCGRIRARQDLFSDVQVQIGPRVRHVTEWITGGCEFYRSDGRVQWRAMDA